MLCQPCLLNITDLLRFSSLFLQHRLHELTRLHCSHQVKQQQGKKAEFRLSPMLFSVLISPPSPIASIQQQASPHGAGGRSLNADSAFSWQLVHLGYVQLNKAIVRSLKQREQEDLACGDNATHASSFIQQFQAPFGFIEGEWLRHSCQSVTHFCALTPWMWHSVGLSQKWPLEIFPAAFFCRVSKILFHHSFETLPRCWALL